MAYNSLPQIARDKLNLVAPAGPPLTGNTSNEVTPTPVPKVNPAMPATPAAAYRFDPATGTIVPVKPVAQPS